MILELRGLRKEYRRGEPVLHGIDFEVGSLEVGKVADFIACAVTNSLNPAACEGAKVPGGFRRQFAKAAHAQGKLLSGTLPEK